MKRVVCILLMPAVLLTQRAALVHGHGEKQPANHDLRPHVHTNLASPRDPHDHGHHHGPGGPPPHHPAPPPPPVPRPAPTPRPGPAPSATPMRAAPQAARPCARAVPGDETARAAGSGVPQASGVVVALADGGSRRPAARCRPPPRVGAPGRPLY